MRKLGIDYGDSRVGLSITDALGITVQGLETIHHNGNDKLVLKRLEEILQKYEIDTFVVGMPINMNGTKTQRVEVTEKFIHKLRCKFNKVKIETMDERLEIFKRRKKEVEKQILDLQRTLDTINYKCWYYETAKAAGTTTIHDNMTIEDLPEEFHDVKKWLAEN